MAAVHLNFFGPDRPGFVRLFIYEYATGDDLATPILIGTIEEVGEWPDYISGASTNGASLVDDWFAIQWEDEEGVRTDISAKVKGRTETLVGKVVGRVLLNDPSLNESVVAQSAEYVVSIVKHTEDPYDTDLTATYKEVEGMTLLALARTRIKTLLIDQADSYTAGLVSQKSSSGSADTKLIDYLIKEANSMLGISFTFVMLMEDIDPIGTGSVSTISFDESRLAITLTIE